MVEEGSNLFAITIYKFLLRAIEMKFIPYGCQGSTFSVVIQVTYYLDMEDQ